MPPGSTRSTYRATLPVEGYNAQISLLTGMAAAGLMLAGRIGVVRTLPAAEPGALRRLRRTAQALRISWPKAQDYPEFVRSLDPAIPAHAAMLNACTELFRGAGYTAFDGELPAEHPPRGPGHRLRPRHRPAAPTRRSLRRRGLPGPVRPTGTCRTGPGRRSRPCRS